MSFTDRKLDRQIHLGKVKGPYQYRPDLDAAYCNVRAVEWSKPVPATAVPQGALHEPASSLTLFQVRNYAQDFEAVFSGKKKKDTDEDDEAIGFAAEEIQLSTQTFVLKELERHFKGYPFQEFVANLLETMGYRTLVQQKGSDEGIDIIAHKDELKLEPPIIKVQVKSGSGKRWRA